jgi:vancomycin aglycone glucosyltransferase
MRVLLSTIGTRGDVQPMVALAMQLKALGQEVRVCAPPDFRDWVDSFEISFAPIGPEVRSTAKPGPSAMPAKLTADQISQMIEGTVATQFSTIPAAAFGCDVIVAGNALQVAARSVAERMGIRYVFTAYAPVTLPSPHHAPPPVPAWTPKDPSADNLALWAEDAERWTERWAPALNLHRAAAGLGPITDVRSHILTDTPWLAADTVLAPWPDPDEPRVFQPGAWILRDSRSLSRELETFLDAGEPPVYLGFGSIRAPQDLSKVAIEAVRANGRRAIVSRGWADLSLIDDAPDCLAIDEVNLQALFKRVAVVVHHGGAGTTTAATHAGAPQVAIPQHYDQHYWAKRVAELGIGVALAPGAPTTESLVSALEQALQPEVASRAKTIASSVTRDGAQLAAQRLIADHER